MRKWSLWLTLAACLLVCQAIPSSSTEAPHPTAAEVADAYKGYQQITPRGVYVNMELAILCRGASQAEVEAARVKYGPHANASVVIYMNKPAATAFRAKANAYPPGAVVVKQKRLGSHRNDVGDGWVRDGNDGVGGMIKRPAGYDPAHGDWEYFYFDQPVPLTSSGIVQSLPKIESGRIASCVQCHEGAKRTDHVFGSWGHPDDPDNPFSAPSSPLKLR